LDAVATRHLHELTAFDLVVFVSPSAVARFFAVRPDPWPTGPAAAVVGAGSARALRDHGVADPVEPATGAGAEALLDCPELAALAGQRVLLVAGRGGRELLGDTLRSRGAQVTRLALYRRVPPADPRPLLQWLKRYPCTALLATSNTTLDHLDQLVSAEDRRQLLDVQLVVPSSSVVQKAESLGYRRILRAANATDAALIAALELAAERP
jgi:uroporphyrinogen-III synthase